MSYLDKSYKILKLELLVPLFLSVPFMDFEMLSNKFQVIILLQSYYNVINKTLYKYNVTFQLDVDRRYNYI